MRQVDVSAPHFTDRVAQARSLVGDRARPPELGEAGRGLFGDALTRLSRAIGDRGADEQLLHGEPHPSNVLRTRSGQLFIDLETCCRGPVEFDGSTGVIWPHLPTGGGPIPVKRIHVRFSFGPTVLARW
jgi:Ser/Thr protein kinase RdoA (MazF antagonist)